MLSIKFIVPVYNEEACLPSLIEKICRLRERYSTEFDLGVLFVDDGSTDGSVEIITKQCKKKSFIQLISLSRNFGHQVAITAGIDHADADYLIVMDSDMQDPPELVGEFYHVMLQGNDIVYAKRSKRAGETFIKTATATAFYATFKALSTIRIHDNAGDFYMFNRKVQVALKAMPEKHRFLRGLLPWAGFKAGMIEYERNERLAGSTKFPMKKMLAFSIDAMFSFSSLPMRLATFSGLLIMSCGIVFGLWIAYQKMFGTQIPAGLTSTLLAILIVGGLQVFMIGVVGEYIGRIYEEVKARPLYLIQDKFNL